MFLCPKAPPPGAPILDVNPPSPTDGDVITFTCTTSNQGPVLYEFRKGSSNAIVQAYSSNNVYQISPATISTYDGSYTCYVTARGEESPSSLSIAIQGMI